MRIAFSDAAGADFRAWEAESPETVARIRMLIGAIGRDPFQGIGKPEALRGILSGWWSRRIGRDHRLVYRLTGKGESLTIEIAQCRYWP